jgi:hypothetical protein
MHRAVNCRLSGFSSPSAPVFQAAAALVILTSGGGKPPELKVPLIQWAVEIDGDLTAGTRA